MPRITLDTISEEVGLSKYAVSRALSGKSGVSEETRARVAEAAQRLGYQRPQNSRMAVLGAVFSDTDFVNGELHMQIQSGVQREAERLGYSVKLRWTHDADDLASLAHECDGLLIVGRYDRDAYARAYATDTPIVRSGWLEPLEPVDSVGGTDHEAGFAVASYLLRLGHREIAFVHGDRMLRGRSERLHGLREGVEHDASAIVHDMRWGPSGGFALELDALLALGRRPTAYFCAHDGLAITVISELLSRGVRIPGEASVIGFGDFSPAQQIRPPLTSVKVFGERFGEAAVRQLDARLRGLGHSTFPVRIKVPNEIIERGSAGPAPKPADQQSPS